MLLSTRMSVESYVSDHVKERIRKIALTMGFAGCGFTDAEPLDCERTLATWIARRRHGHMDYLARSLERRTRPRSLLARAESVIVVAWPYDPPPPPSSDWKRKLTGRIAAYALGRDYHDVIGGLLADLAAEIERTCGGCTRVHVDAGPLVEKDLARRAGLGWFGRNTNLLLPTKGSWILLGCLLTEVRFEPDLPFGGDHCGTCRACVPACPTGALDDGPTIDARACISYLTIEHRGPFARELRAKVENWVFGCDLCQQVCPWGADTSAHRPELEPSLPQLLRLGERQFRERYAGTAVARAKRRGLARNAAVALGNSGNSDAVDALAWALAEHDEPLVRAHAAWALGRVRDRAAISALARAGRLESVPPVRLEIDLALAGIAAASVGETQRGPSPRLRRGP